MEDKHRLTGTKVDDSVTQLFVLIILEFFHNRSKGESVKHGGGKISELLCNELWSINTGTKVDDSVTQLFVLIILEFFHNRSKGESVKHGGGKISELLCNELWTINTG